MEGQVSRKRSAHGKLGRCGRGLHTILGISPTKHTCNYLPRHTSDETQPEYKACGVILDSGDPDSNRFLTSGNLFFQRVALRLHVRDLRAEDADLVIDAGGVRHSIQLLRPGNGSIPQALKQFFRFLKLLDKIKMPIQFR